MKTIEELLKPRYLVVANYPHNPFEVNKILELQPIQNHWYYEWAESEGMEHEYESFFKEYPHLFRKLEWWERREESDMPEYVKAIKKSEKLFYKKDEIIKVRAWHQKNERFWLVNFICIPNEHTKYHYVSDFIPATETEYNNYITTKK